jgi:vancomycin permeability regulator SanA
VNSTTRTKPTEERPGRVQRFALSFEQLRDKRLRRRLYVRIVAAMLVVLVAYLTITFVQVWWTSRQDGERHADAAVVLGAAQYNGRPSKVLKGRLDHALELYRKRLVRFVVVTGGKKAGDRYTEAFTGFKYLREKGVPEKALLTEVKGTNTWESLAASARILRRRGLTDVVLVTDGYHALRVNAIADELGLNASVSPSRSGGSLTQLVKETGAVAVGRIVGFRRLVHLDDEIGEHISKKD